MSEQTAIQGVANAVRSVANAITPMDAMPGHDANGGTVASLTEAVMGLTASMSRIADAIESVAEAMRND
jgi:hypothetical protein